MGPAKRQIGIANSTRKILDKRRAAGLTLPSRKSKMCRSANDLAKDILAKTDAPTTLDVSKILRRWSFGANTNRANIRQAGQQFVYSDTFGLVKNYIGVWSASAVTKKYPFIFKLLLAWISNTLPCSPECKAFLLDGFTTLTLNKGRYGKGAGLHRDANNQGPTLLASTGNFSKGELLYWPCDDGKLSPIGASASTDCVTLCTNNMPRVIDGRKTHAVADYEKGQQPTPMDRFSVVCYSLNSCLLAPGAVRSECAKSYGIPMPSQTRQASLAIADARRASTRQQVSTPTCTRCEVKGPVGAEGENGRRWKCLRPGCMKKFRVS